MSNKVYCFVMLCNLESFLSMGVCMYIVDGATCLVRLCGIVYSWDFWCVRG